MRFGIIQYRRLRAVLIKRLEYEGDAPVMRAGIQLSVRESAGAAFSILNVAFRIQNSAPAKFLHSSLSLLKFLAALDDKRFKPRSCQRECGKHPCRAKADNQRAKKRIPLCQGGKIRNPVRL